jgi:hypothetical protein
MNMIPLQLPPGIVRGANPDDAPGRWFDCNLIRWRDGVMEPVGGWEKMTSQPLPDTPRRIRQWRDNKNRLQLLVGTASSLNAYDDGNWTPIQPADFKGFDTTTVALGFGAGPYGVGAFGVPINAPSKLQHLRHTWSFGQWGEDVISVASSDGRLFYYTSQPVTPLQHPSKPRYKVSGQVEVITTAPSNLRAVTVTPERHALAIRDREIVWCSREDVRDWDFLSTTNTAGQLPLQSDTILVSLVPCREGTVVFSETQAFLVRYVNLPYIYGYDTLGSANLYAANAATEFEGQVAWMDQTGFGVYRGGAISTLDCPLTDYVFSDIDPTWGPRVAHAFTNGLFNEVWWHYPSKGNEECNRFVMWNWVENWWSMGELPRSAGFGAGAGDKPILGAPGGNVYSHETGWAYDDFDAVGNIFIASSTLNLGVGEQAMQINQLIPSNGSQYDATRYTLMTRMTPGQAEAVSGPYNARPDGYVDTRAQGRDVRLKIEATRATDWSIGRIRMNVSAGGRR